MDSSPDRETAKFREQIPHYVAGIMSPSERIEFEAWLIEHPEFAAEIAAEQQLRRGFLAAHRSGLLGALSRGPLWRQWLPAASAAAVAVVVTLAIVLEMGAPDRTARQDIIASLADHADLRHGTQIVGLARTRSTSTTPDIRVTVAQLPDHLVLQPDVVVYTCPDGNVYLECDGGTKPSTPQYGEYDLAIVERSNGVVVHRSQPVTSTPETPLAFVLHPRALEVGDYDLLVSGRSVDHEEVVARFWLQINPNP
jgi:hypothetical protein